ncbi:DUF5677 domain-containing protein [Devosia sp.]|uniref:DUF5677 domain-containing protein n=1 Tax=Devosia sp. TaxID=1871048 RepID=UPI001AC02860|nr:DUF5677 domain-containing protein [Devosia sp.]MBN9307762.1 hypothetical protein [Devosia sp.]
MTATALLIGELKRAFEETGQANDLVAVTLRHLIGFMSDRGQAAYMLLSWGYSWDCEIILRSFSEAAVKVLFICYAPEEDRAKLANEYWSDFDVIHSKRRGQKASYAEVPFEDADVAIIFKALQDPSVAGDGMSKNDRRVIEQRWSFSDMVETLSKPAAHREEVYHIKGLLHHYGIASHFIHADKSAMDLLLDRKSRESSELLALRAAHAARILSDMPSMWFLCAHKVYDHFNIERDMAPETMAAYLRINELAEPFMKTFTETQKDFYSRWSEGNQE